MAKFERYLPDDLLEQLKKLSQGTKGGRNWWQDVQASSDLKIAIRAGYLNVYAQGQSVFKISSGLGKGASPLVELHYKYLLKPSLPKGKEYLRFDGEKFFMGKAELNPATLIQIKFVAGETVKELATSARIYSGQEKQGVHTIALKNPSVVDLEIAFTKIDDDGNRGAQRIDLAALHKSGGRISVKFYEAKLASDTRLRGNRGKPEIIAQVQKYDDFLERHEDEIRKAYVNVCRTLVSLRHAGSRTDISPLVEEVCASPDRLIVDTATKLLIFGYDQDHRHKESLFNKRIEFLKENSKLAGRIFSSGQPDFDLGKLRY